jgi:hypothetical protein
MSFSGHVVCNCYKEGRTTEPPHREYVKIDYDGLYVELPTQLYREDEERYFKMHDEFDDWKSRACEHANMELADEYLCNISGMFDFRRLLSELEEEGNFSILKTYLPKHNEGILPLEFVSEALAELKALEECTQTEEKISLIVKNTNEIIANTIANHQRLFKFNSDYTFGLNREKGFFIYANKKDNDFHSDNIKFSSWNFAQHKSSQKSYLFSDMTIGTTLDCPLNLQPRACDPNDQYEFEVKIETVSIINHYSYIIGPLKKLIDASILSRNPICWK